MKRKIIEIDQEKCNGCGLCVDACHEQALVLIDGKATLISESYCDGLGDCLPECPVDAIQIIEREADPYDDEAVQARIKSGHIGCPSSMAKIVEHPKAVEKTTTDVPSQLGNWPVQLQLVPTNAPYFDGADLLIAADCTAFSYGNFHQEFVAGRVCLIGCPKLDVVEYTEKLTEILKNNDIKSVTVVRMEVPCCGGIANAVKNALIQSGKMIPWGIHTVTLDGQLA